MRFTKPSKTIQTSLFPTTTTPTSIADFVNPETYESDLFSPFYDFSLLYLMLNNRTSINNRVPVCEIKSVDN